VIGAPLPLFATKSGGGAANIAVVVDACGGDRPSVTVIDDSRAFIADAIRSK
jgi:hypothetical protein